MLPVSVLNLKFRVCSAILSCVVIEVVIGFIRFAVDFGGVLTHWLPVVPLTEIIDLFPTIASPKGFTGEAYRGPVRAFYAASDMPAQ